MSMYGSTAITVLIDQYPNRDIGRSPMMRTPAPTFLFSIRISMVRDRRTEAGEARLKALHALADAFV